MIQDIRYAVRLLLRKPGFAALAVLTLALGIGTTTAMFTVVNAVLLRPLPYPDPGRLMMIRADGVTGAREPLLSLAEIDSLRQHARTLSQVEGLVVVNGNLGMADDPEPMERVPAASATEGFLEMLGVQPVLGRPLTSRDRPTGAPLAVLLSHELWQRRYAGDPSILERTIRVNNMPVTVAGVLPPGFRLRFSPDTNIPARVDVWLPVTFDDSPNDRAVTTIARLKSGASPEEAGAELSALGPRLTEAHPERYARTPLRLHVDPLQADTARQARPALLALMGAVMFVLLIAVANLANLLLTRTTIRSRELAVRSALGAGRGRLLRQLVTEGLLIGALGGLAGLLLASWAEWLLLWLRPSTLPELDALPLDMRVLGFALLSTVLCSLIFSLVPAWRGTRQNPQETLKGTLRGGTSRQGGLRRALVVTELALAIVLLTGAGLMLRTLIALHDVPVGFRSGGVLTLQATMQPSAFREYQKKWQFYQTAMERIAGLPGVASVSAVRPLPLEALKITQRYAVGGRELLASSFTTLPHYFSTMGIRLQAGRDFTADDMIHSRPVAIVDEAFARSAWPGGEALGQAVTVLGRREGTPLTVVGVVSHVRAETLREAGNPQVYLPYHQYPLFDMAVVVQTAGDPLRLAAPIRAELDVLGGNRPAHTIRLMDDYVGDMMAESRFAFVVLMLFAGLALALSMIGVYGVISHSTALRTREIGVRMALGATRGDILRLVVGSGLRWAAAGVVLGVGASAALTRYLTTLLFEVQPTDPVTLGGVAVLLLAVACLACYIPARRAGRMAAATALRAE
jgi:putative ABC transport system permease protein